MFSNLDERLDELTDFLFGKDPYLRELQAIEKARESAFSIHKKDPVNCDPVIRTCAEVEREVFYSNLDMLRKNHS